VRQTRFRPFDQKFLAAVGRFKVTCLDRLETGLFAEDRFRIYPEFFPGMIRVGNGKLPAGIGIFLRPFHAREQGGVFKIPEKTVDGQKAIALAAADESFDHREFPKS
jgi:hypothetical protein